MITLITGGIVKIVINWFLVARPGVNIYGAAVGSLVSYFVMMVLNYGFMCRTLDKDPNVLRILKGPVIACAAMAATAWVLYFAASHLFGARMGRMEMLLSMAVAIVAAVAVYALFAIRMKAITAEDMKLIPGGEKISKLLHLR